MLISINPYNNRIIKEYAEFSDDEVDIIISQTQKAFQTWRKTGIKHRKSLMRSVAGVLEDNKEELAVLITKEMGKLIQSSRAEIEKCAWVCKYYAENTERFLKNEIVSTDAGKSYVTFNPLGVILTIMPWNFPFWQVFRFAAPGLMAGNACVLKHSANVSGCALAIEDLFIKAGFPENLFRTLLIGKDNVGRILENTDIKAVTLTGSTPAGKAVASAAGSEIKKTVLELGGNDPYIILDDADLEETVEACLISKMINAGQSCIAVKRFIVTPTIRERFEAAFVGKMEKMRMGDPFDPEVQLGPLARSDLRDELHEKVKKSIALGAVCLTGGYIPESEGVFYPPTVLTNVIKGMPAYEEELFGPVAAIIPVQNEQEAITVANDSDFGLGAAIFSRNLQKAELIAANEIEAGNCFINTYVKSDPRLPFGGIKKSGFGRELSSYGIKEFVNIKTVYIK